MEFTHLSAMDVFHKMRADAATRPFHEALVWRAKSFDATAGEPMTLRRAEALNAVLRRCSLVHFEGELLVGSSLGRLSPEAPGWKDRIEDARKRLAPIGGRHFGTHSDHHAPDYPTLMKLGLGGIKARVRQSLAGADETGKTFLQSVLVAIDGASGHFERWAAHLAAIPGPLASTQADMLRHLAQGPPRTFWEGLQLTWLTHTIFQLDERGAMALGRLDQFLWPLYQADLAAGRISPQDAQTLLDHLFAKLTGLGGDVQNIAVGGLTPDGQDATNELSFMILEACKRVGRAGGNVTARVHKRTPPAFLLKCAEVIRTGVGYPAVFNDDVEVPALVAQGYPIEEARDYCFVGCIEVFIPGRHAPWADSRFNLLRLVNLTLYNGVDSLTGKPAGPATGSTATWEEFFEAYLVQLRHAVAAHVRWVNEMEAPCQQRPMEFTSPFMSALAADCIARARDVNDGGARYPANHGIGAMGIGVTADALAAIRQFVYQQKRFTLAELRTMLSANFEGFEAQRQMLLKGAPKYGNNDDRVDELAIAVTQAVGEEFLKYRTAQGGQYWALMAANINNIDAGREVGASADGRRALEPLSDAASPTFGRDLNGPTAVIRSVAKLPYRLCPGGNVINMKLHPSSIEGPKGLASLAALVRTCFDLGGIQLQFNTTGRETLQAAIERPAEYENLVVRVSGFSAQFVYLDKSVKDDILARTEHALV